MQPGLSVAPVDEDEAAGLLEDACMPVEQVLKRLTNGEITGPIDSRESTFRFTCII